MSVSLTGACTRFNACAIGGNLHRRITSPLIHSGSAGILCKAWVIARRNEPSASPSVSG
jgi:hypothetical protein